MSKNIFITGTGTDVGKTYITGLLLKKLKETGAHAAYYKAAMSGNERDESGQLIPGDALLVKQISKIDQTLEEMCPYVYEHAVSPHLASRLEGNPVRMSRVRSGFEQVCSEYEYVVMEGSGGILCPIGFDEERIQLEDIVKEFSLASILIADAGLGTINSVVLTAEYMKARNLEIRGIIFNHYHPGDVMEEDNIRMCRLMTDIPCLACVQEHAAELEISKENLDKIFQ